MPRRRNYEVEIVLFSDVEKSNPLRWGIYFTLADKRFSGLRQRIIKFDSITNMISPRLRFQDRRVDGDAHAPSEHTMRTRYQGGD